MKNGSFIDKDYFEKLNDSESVHNAALLVHSAE